MNANFAADPKRRILELEACVGQRRDVEHGAEHRDVLRVRARAGRHLLLDRERGGVELHDVVAVVAVDDVDEACGGVDAGNRVVADGAGRDVLRGRVADGADRRQ
jgi:hypothetical protein